MQAMIFAAGLGTRLKPLTDIMPKALVEVGGVPLLRRVIFSLHDVGFDRIVVNVHHFASQIEAYLQANDNFGLDIRISDETKELLETGGGLKHASQLFLPQEPILIHNVDILSNVNLLKFYHKPVQGANLLVSKRKTKRYLLFDGNMRLVGWTNIETKQVKSPYPELLSMPYELLIERYKKFAFSGIHVFSPKLFSKMADWPQRFSIIDFYLKVCDQEEIYGCVKEDLKLLDVGKLSTLHEAETFLRDLEISR